MNKELRRAETSEAVARHYMKRLGSLSHEEVHLLLAGPDGLWIRSKQIAYGTCSCAYVSMRRLCTEALLSEASGMILVHNHPSGKTAPSGEDLFFTRRVQAAGSLIGIRLLDSIIVGRDSYLSFAEEGLLRKDFDWFHG